MKCLSRHQPWARLLVLGEKTIETRSWQTAHRGPLAIHASKQFPALAVRLCNEEPFKSALAKHGFTAANLPRGAIVGQCIVAHVKPVEDILYKSAEDEAFGDFRPGCWGWMMMHAFALAVPIPLRGQRGVFDLPADIALEIGQHEPVRSEPDQVPPPGEGEGAGAPRAEPADAQRHAEAGPPGPVQGSGLCEIAPGL